MLSFSLYGDVTKAKFFQIPSTLIIIYVSSAYLAAWTEIATISLLKLSSYNVPKNFKVYKGFSIVLNSYSKTV